MTDTIFALSSGAPPAAIGVVRITGPRARQALSKLAGSLPECRKASLRTLVGSDGQALDRALVLWFAGPHTATGEDLVELHCHGGRAVVRAVEAELARHDGLRAAQPGEFTRRAFENGRIDLAEAEGLADLLTAETELQRRSAMNSVGGALSRQVEGWRKELIALSARLEAMLDFADEDDVAVDLTQLLAGISNLASSLEESLSAPSAERLREGVRVVIAGPPNAGKSSLFNALLDDDAAIVADVAGTTRDVIERSVAFAGVAITLVDTAGIHEQATNDIERIGIGRSRQELGRSDLVLWLGAEGEGPTGAIEVDARCDLGANKSEAAVKVSALMGRGLKQLHVLIADRSRSLLPRPGTVALNARQRSHIHAAHQLLASSGTIEDPLVLAEQLRRGRVEFDSITGRAATEDMLKALFGAFCIGK